MVANNLFVSLLISDPGLLQRKQLSNQQIHYTSECARVIAT